MYQKGGPKSNFFNSALQIQDMAISQPRSQKWKKNNGTFFSPTKNIKYPYVSQFWPEIWPYFDIEYQRKRKSGFLICYLEWKLWPYLSLRAKIDKTKGTIFSWTFLVGDDNMPLFFSFLASWPKYKHFLFWREELKNLAFCSKFGLRLWSFRET